MSTSPFLTRDDLETFRNVRTEPRTVHVDEIAEGGPRTLIWGYTVDRHDFHVFFDGKKIRRVIIDGSYVVSESEGFTIEVGLATPDKRILPECCDRTFCELVQRREGNLPFTTYTDRREPGPFFGPTEW